MAIRRRSALILMVIAAALLVALIIPGSRSSKPGSLPAGGYLLSARQDWKAGRNRALGPHFLPYPLDSHRRLRLKEPRRLSFGYFVKARRVDAVLDVGGALWHRQVVIKSLKLNDATINLVSDPNKGWNFENPTSAKTSDKVSPEGSLASAWGVISDVEIAGGQLVASYLLHSDEPGIIIFEAHNFSSKLAQVDLGAFMDPSSSASAAQGDLQADSMRFVSIEATHVIAKLRLMAKQAFFTGATWKLTRTRDRRPLF